MKIGKNVTEKEQLIGAGAFLNYYDTYKFLETEVRSKINPVT